VDAKVNDPQAAAAANFAVKGIQAKHKKLTMDRIAGAASQVVAGMKYRAYLKLTDTSSGSPVQRQAEAAVYRDLGGKYSLTSWEWKK